MKWSLPLDGSRRIVQKFAWFPLLLRKEDKIPRTKIWLEKYYSYETCSWDGKWYHQFSLQYADQDWIETGVLSTKQQRVKNKLGLK